MIALLVWLKHRCSWIWKCVELINGWLFGLLYTDFPEKAARILEGYACSDFKFSLVTKEEVPALARFLKSVPSEQLTYFNPHDFDGKALRRLLNNRAFLMMKITRRDTETSFVGYFFLRCFFIGKAFHGLLVDSRYSNRGLGTAMWVLSMEICHTARLRMFATISEHNIASLRSVSKATHVRLVRKLPDDYVFIECTRLTHE